MATVQATASLLWLLTGSRVLYSGGGGYEFFLHLPLPVLLWPLGGSKNSLVEERLESS